MRPSARAVTGVVSSSSSTPRAYCSLVQRHSVPAFVTQSTSFQSMTNRWMSKERASKIVKPGEVIVVDGAPHKIGKITQGKRGKGGGYVR